MDSVNIPGPSGRNSDDLGDFLKELEVLRQAAQILGVPVKDIIELRKSRNAGSHDGNHIMSTQLCDFDQSLVDPDSLWSGNASHAQESTSLNAVGLFDNIDLSHLDTSSLTSLTTLPPAHPSLNIGTWGMDMLSGEATSTNQIDLSFLLDGEQSAFDPTFTLHQQSSQSGIDGNPFMDANSHDLIELEGEVAEYRPDDGNLLADLFSDDLGCQSSDGTMNPNLDDIILHPLPDNDTSPEVVSSTSGQSAEDSIRQLSIDLTSTASDGSTPTLPGSSTSSGTVTRLRDIRPKDPLLSDRIAVVQPSRSNASTGTTTPTAAILHKTSAAKVQRRRPFELCQRQETSETRKTKACIRCHMQRIRCVPNPEDPFGDCRTCAKIKGPTLSQLPCLRYKISDSQLLDKGPHPRFSWTRRWTSMKICEIQDWESPVIKTITLTQDVGNASYSLQVRKFIPQPGDSLERTWNTPSGTKGHPCAPYALANMRETGKMFVRFVDGHIGTFIEHYVNKDDALLRKTYEMAYEHSRSSTIKDEKVLLHAVLRLWVGSRMESKQERVSGEEVLGMTPQDWDIAAGNYGKYLVPPVLQAQIEILTASMILLPMQKEVLKILQRLIEKNMARSWFTIYLALFVLLHSCSLLTRAEEVRAAREGKIGSQARYFNHQIVEEFHSGARTMLAYFHYCNKGGHPFAMDWTRPNNVAFAELSSYQVQFIKETSELVKHKLSHFQHVRTSKMFGDDYYFISQLYDLHWIPLHTV